LFDVGVVLADRPFYVCLSLSQIGLTSDDSIVSLHSSCDCIDLKIVTYRIGDDRAMASGILLEGVPHDLGSAKTITPARLRIDVDATLADGRNHRFIVQFIESQLVDPIATSGADE
jgi:hypothetical protein